MPPFVRKNLMFVVGAAMLGLSLVFSTFSVIKVMSAPLATVPSTVNVPNKVGFEGYLVNADGSGTPISGTHTLYFQLYDAQNPDCTGLTQTWSETQTVTVNNGVYAVQLGSVAPLSPSLFDGTICLGVTVDSGNQMTPLTKISSVPFALNAANANTVNNLSVAESGTDQHIVASNISGTVSVSGGLNVGAATDAMPGDIKASGDIYSNGRKVSNLTDSYLENLYLAPITTTNQLKVQVENNHPAILTIEGKVYSVTSADPPPTVGFSGTAGLKYIYANASGTTFTLSASDYKYDPPNPPSGYERRIAEIHWTGSALKYESLFVYPPGEPSVYYARASRSSSQAIPNATWTAVSFDTEAVDTDSMYPGSGQNSRIAIVHSGIYLVNGQISLAASPTALEVQIYLNGATILAYTIVPYAYHNITVARFFSAGDYLELRIKQTSGGAINTAAPTYLTVVALSP